MHSVTLCRFFVLTAEGEVELHRSYQHRKCRQYKIRHRFDPHLKKVWQKPRREARKKRLL